MDEFTPQIGLNPGVTNEQYHGSDGTSKSKCDDISPDCGNTPRHFWARHVDPEREPEVRTEALIVGDAYHCAALEPDLFPSRFVVAPEDAPNRPSKRQIGAKKPSADTLTAIDFWRDFDREHEGKTVLKQEQYDLVIRMRDVLLNHPRVGALVRAAHAEQTFYAIDPETGALIKCRLDGDLLEAYGMIIDLKSTVSASLHAFELDMRKYRYDGQAWWYPHVIHSAYGPGIVQSFAWISQEKTWPHAVGYHFIEQEQIDEAGYAMRRDLEMILECQEKERAGYPPEVAWPDFATMHGARSARVGRRRI